MGSPAVANASLLFQSNRLCSFYYIADDINAIGNNFIKLGDIVRAYVPSVTKRQDGKIPLIEKLISEKVIPA